MPVSAFWTQIRSERGRLVLAISDATRCGTDSKAHLSAAEIGQVMLGCTAFEVDFEVHGGKVGGRTPLEKSLLLFGKICAILRAVWRGADVYNAGVFVARVLVADGMADVRVPEHRVAGHDLWDGDQAGDEIGVPLRADAKRAAWGCAAQIRLIHVVLKRAKEYIGNALRDRNEPQSSVFGPLACQRRPALIGAEHAAHGGRRNLLGVQPVRGIERVIPLPVTGEDVLVHLLIAGVDPALHRARIHVWGKSKRLVPGLTPAHTV